MNVIGTGVIEASEWVGDNRWILDLAYRSSVSVVRRRKPKVSGRGAGEGQQPLPAPTAQATVHRIVADDFANKDRGTAESYFWRNARAACRWGRVGLRRSWGLDGSDLGLPHPAEWLGPGGLQLRRATLGCGGAHDLEAK